MNMQKGFTLVELVIVIVILGILSAIAIPLYTNYQEEARQSLVNAVAGAFNSANYMNVAGCKLHEGVVTAQKCIKVNKCKDLIPAVSVPGAILGVGNATSQNAGQYLIMPVDNNISISNGSLQACRIQLYKEGTVYTATYYAQGAAN